MIPVRPPAVAGAFYPASPAALAARVDALVREAQPSQGRAPKAIIAPHAGYIYSGPVAGSAYARVASLGATVTRVVVIGPAHRALVRGMASPDAERLRTPLGDLEVDAAALRLAPDVAPDAPAHAREHSLEVQLPFIQRLFPCARVVPIAVGRAGPEEVARALLALWGGPETLIVVSSDLSHYLPYDVARATDERTAARILRFEAPIDFDEACGAAGINGLLLAARSKGLRAELVDLRSSGDTAGPHDEVVGYGAFAFYEEEAR